MQSALKPIILLSLGIGISLSHASANESLAKNPDLVTSLPGYGKLRDKVYSGYLAITSKSAQSKQNIYYLYVAAKHDSDNTPLILWLNGGPGSSSFYGFFTENGPYKIQRDLTLQENYYSWHNAANYLTFDQPIGVGYSYPNKDYKLTNEAQSTEELYQAILAFYQKYPQLQKRKLYIAGESYAGRYIPEVAQLIVQQNKQSKLRIPLAGIMLGDAWVNPLLQQSQDSAYAYSHGLIDDNDKVIVDGLYQKCAQAITAESISSIKTNQLCGKISDYIYKRAGIDLHNIQNGMEPESSSLNTIEYSALRDYLNQSQVKQSLHVYSQESFNLYSDMVGNALEIGEQNSVAPIINQLLKQKIKILVYNGLNDAKDCNFMGTSLWLKNLNWEKFNSLSQQPYFNHQHKMSGYITSYRNLSYIKLLNAGHMAPEDQPQNSLDMINDFIHTNTDN